jgi:hypothetical protein
MTIAYRVTRVLLGGVSWIADFAYRSDAEKYIKTRPRQLRPEYHIDCVERKEAA